MKAVAAGVALAVGLAGSVIPDASPAAPAGSVMPTCLESIYPSGSPSGDERVVFGVVTLPRPPMVATSATSPM